MEQARESLVPRRQQASRRRQRSAICSPFPEVRRTAGPFAALGPGLQAWFTVSSITRSIRTRRIPETGAITGAAVTRAPLIELNGSLHFCLAVAAWLAGHQHECPLLYALVKQFLRAVRRAVKRVLIVDGSLLDGTPMGGRK